MNLQNLKKRNQETEKKLIEISKKNIILEQEIFNLKLTISQKNKLNEFK